MVRTPDQLPIPAFPGNLKQSVLPSEDGIHSALLRTYLHIHREDDHLKLRPRLGFNAYRVAGEY